MSRTRKHMCKPGYAAKKAAYDKARVARLRDTLRDQNRARYLANRSNRIAAAINWAKKNCGMRSVIANAYKARKRAQSRIGMCGRATAAWLAEQFMACSYCGSFCASAFEIDHVQPLSRGGLHTEDNLAISCVECNRRKSNKTLLTFLRDRATPQSMLA